VADLLIFEDLAVANLRSVADEGAEDLAAIADGHVVHDYGVLNLHVRSDFDVAPNATVVDCCRSVFHHHILVDHRVDDRLFEKVCDFCFVSLRIFALLFAIKGDESLLEIILSVSRHD